MLDDLKRNEQPLTRVGYAGCLVRLSRLEAAVFDLLWMNRGRVVDNEWVFRLVWPDVDRLDMLRNKRYDVVLGAIKDKMPGLIHTVRGEGRFIPAGSGILIQRAAHDPRLLLVRPPAPGTPVEPPKR